MDSSPPYPIGPGQRVLAAIVFTDVVSFSARMHREEVGTLKLLERDFAEMRATCEKYSGTVLKTTGDGLLLYFTSAVQAVACAQKMQRDFARRAKEEPSEALKHRIGIHLGEVFVTDQDVMGDGVNIAARIQTQAEPGGIVISQTVHDVVKNKLKLDVVKLGARELKNIPEAVAMYRVLLEAPKPGPAVEAAPMPAAPPPSPAFSLTGGQKLALAAALIAGLGLTAWLFLQARTRHEEDLARSEALRTLLSAKAEDSEREAKNADATGQGGRREETDFAALALRAGPTQDDGAVRKQATEQMQPLLAWISPAMERYTKDRPLLVRALGGALNDELTVFTGPDHRLYFAEGGAIRPRNWSDLKPGEFGAIIVSALLNSPTPPPREVVRGAEAYAYFHRVPAMIAPLREAAPRQ